MVVAGAFRKPAGQGVLQHRGLAHVECTVQHGDVHSESLASPLPVQQRHGEAPQKLESRPGVTQGKTRLHGGIPRLAALRNQTASGCRNDVHTGQMGQGAVGAEAGDGAVNQPGVDLQHFLIANAQLFQRAGLEVLHHHIHLGRQVQYDLLALFGAHVDGDALLAPVVLAEVQADVVDVGAVLPGDVSRAGPLHLDDLGSHVRQHHPAEWGG